MDPITAVANAVAATFQFMATPMGQKLLGEALDDAAKFEKLVAGVVGGITKVFKVGGVIGDILPIPILRP